MRNVSHWVGLVSIVVAAVSIVILPAKADTIVEEPVVITATSTAPGPHHIEKPKPKPTATTSLSGDCQKYKDLIAQYDWPVDVAMQICRDESHGNPTTINYGDKHYADRAHTELICVGSDGLFQIACFWPQDLGYARSEALNPAINIKIAYEIYEKYGFYPWSTYKG